MISSLIFQQIRKAGIGILAFMLIFGLPQLGVGQNQSLEETLQQLSQDAAQQYVAPISSALGSNFNGGWFHKAPEPKKFGFNIELGFVAMGSFFPTQSTHFETSGQFTFSVNEAQNLVNGISNTAIQNELIAQLTTQPSSVNISGATVIGSSDDFITIDFPGGTYQTSYGPVDLPSKQVVLPIAGFGELASVNVLPLVAPQLTLGTIMGTQLIVRYLPAMELNADLGKVKYSGFGIQHNPFVWLGNNPLPFNLALGYYRQSGQVGDIFKFSASAFGINASKRLGFRFLNITPYAGYIVENSSMEVTYQYLVDTPTGTMAQDITFDLEGENKSRFTVGLGLRFLIINLNVDYNFAKYNSVTAGLNVAL